MAELIRRILAELLTGALPDRTLDGGYKPRRGSTEWILERIEEGNVHRVVGRFPFNPRDAESRRAAFAELWAQYRELVCNPPPPSGSTSGECHDE